MFSRMLYRSGSALSRVNLARPCLSVQTRNLNIHEYQSQELMRKYNISVANGDAASSVDEAKTVINKISSQGVEDFVIKSQILAGGRGKGTFVDGFQGGVHLATSAEEAEEYVKKMLGNTLVTKQTGASGQMVNKVLIAQRHYIRREAYFAILLDRKTSRVMLVGSKFGGMDIEAVAEENPDAIIKVSVNIEKGITDEQAMKMASSLGFPAKLHSNLAEQIKNMYQLFISTDATQVEINPLVETSNGEVMCVDAKINFDDNAAYRQKEIFELRDFSQEDQREVSASKFDLNFIGLDGSIGCLVNGAGLAMATMDIIQLEGGSPANFLDVGGGATDKQVTEALKIIAGDPKVKAILINIFGGIMRCDVIATGILNAVKTLDLKIPLVVRLSGTNVEQAYQMIRDSKIQVITARDLGEAARKAVEVTHIIDNARKANLKVTFEMQ
mmetsp:Transcript_10608/g.18056  ORF Transcript_10608/g.18056 Transcript_10608/m.18056 type:complete len:443 (+) Transcript_10608:45-1373(+)